MSRVAPVSIVPRTARSPESYVLLVDDHEPSLRRLDEVVTLSGHRCVATSSGTEALLCCDRSRPRVVVTDLNMPNLDGRGLAQWLQARHPSVPIILLTGHSFTPQSLGQMKRIFTAVLSKPVDIEQFLGLLDRLMPPLAKRERDAGRP